MFKKILGITSILLLIICISAAVAGSGGVPFADLSVDEQMELLAKASPDDRRALLSELKREMEIDALTGADNRKALRRIERQMVQATSQVAFILVDLDHFKQINDKRGHDAGDEVLKQISATAREGLAQLMSEVVQKHTRDHLVRFGGEEFLVILEQSTAEHARVVAERLRAKIAEAVIAKYPDLKVTASFGIAAGQAESPVMWNALIQAADSALYEAKNGGRNQVKVATPEKVCEILATR